MAKTSNVRVDTTKIKETLTIFDNLQEELDTIKELSNISGVLLIPKDFYNGCMINGSNLNSSNMDLSSTSDGIFTNYIDVIDKIKEYIKKLELANESGGFFNNNLTDNSIIVADTAIGVTDELIDNLDNQEETVNDEGTTTGNTNINSLDNNSNNVGNIIANTNNTIINDLTNNETNQSTINEVNGQKVIETIKDINDKVVAVAVISNGTKVWYQVDNGKVIVPSITENSGVYTLTEPIIIKDNGQEIEIKPGNYNIEQIIYNPDGSTKIIKINYNNYKLLIHFGSNGSISKLEYIKTQTGVFTINNTNYDIYDMYGNILGKFSNGQYYIYETKYDQNGKVIAFRLSPDGEYENWIYINENTKASEYALVKTMQNNDKTNVSLFEENKGLFGLLGILFVALGVTIAVKKRSKRQEMNQNNEIDEEYNESYYDNNSVDEDIPSYQENLYKDNAIDEDMELSNGNYPIYDVIKDENGLITEARISPLDSEYEYWAKV